MSENVLKGRTALVTGASKGIGLACARLLAEDGATVVIMGRSAEGLAKAKESLLATDAPGEVELYVGDACNEAELQTALKFAHQINNRLDILVPTVGGGNMMPILMRDLESVRREVEVNYISVFLMIRYGAPLMSAGGSIVCISTVGVTQPFWGLGLYGATKAAMERMVKAAAFELGGAGIRVNAVRPGMTMPLEVQQSPDMQATVDLYAAETPLGRIGQPEDIARAVRFLAGPESGWVTGQAFSVDGGQEQGKAPDHMDLYFGKELMDDVRAGKAVELSGDLPQAASVSLREPGS